MKFSFFLPTKKNPGTQNKLFTTEYGTARQDALNYSQGIRKSPVPIKNKSKSK